MNSFDAVRFLFPAGTVSGAPKIRAMEIISELEAEPRGPYAGTVGYFSFNGNADFAITIRTLIARDNEAYIQAGVGIVADSEPAAEWFETEHKGEFALQTSGVPAALASILQALILFSVLTSEFFIAHRVVLRRKRREAWVPQEVPAEP